MNIKLINRAQIEALPGGAWIYQLVSQAAASIGATWDTEHADDGTHKTITASGSMSERGRTVPIGEWVRPTFNAGDFTGESGKLTWTVSSPVSGSIISPIAYLIIGRTMWLAIDIVNSSVSVTSSGTLSIKIPGGYKVKSVAFGDFTYGGFHTVGYCINNGTARSVLLKAEPANSGYVDIINLLSSDSFVTATDHTVRGIIPFEVDKD